MITTEHLAPMSAAKTPEEAAQLFKGLVTQALAQAIADTLDSAIASVKSTSGTSTTIEGWAKLVGGAALHMNWDRQVGLPVGQMTAFAPRKDPEFTAYGGFSVGISVSGSF